MVMFSYRECDLEKWQMSQHLTDKTVRQWSWPHTQRFVDSRRHLLLPFHTLTFPKSRDYWTFSNLT